MFILAEQGDSRHRQAHRLARNMSSCCFASMRASLFIPLLVGALASSLSLALSAEDLPETAYDESEISPSSRRWR